MSDTSAGEQGARTFPIHCPHCGGINELEMPKDACLPMACCRDCEREIFPLPGDCCVFCSYSETACPIGHRHADTPKIG